MFSNLHGLGAVGALETLETPWDLFTLVRTHSAGTMMQNVLKIGEFDVAVKATKITAMDRLPTLKPFVGDPKVPDPSMFLKKETVLHLKDGTPQTDPVEVCRFFIVKPLQNSSFLNDEFHLRCAAQIEVECFPIAVSCLLGTLNVSRHVGSMQFVTFCQYGNCLAVQAAQREEVPRVGKEYFPAELPGTVELKRKSSYR
jgi:hypothetical protein